MCSTNIFNHNFEIDHTVIIRAFREMSSMALLTFTNFIPKGHKFRLEDSKLHNGYADAKLVIETFMTAKSLSKA